MFLYAQLDGGSINNSTGMFQKASDISQPMGKMNSMWTSGRQFSLFHFDTVRVHILHLASSSISQPSLPPPRCPPHAPHSLLSYLRLHPLSHIVFISQASLCCTTVPRERALVSAASCLTKDPSVSPLCVSSAATPPPSSTPLWYIPSLSPGAFLIDLCRLRSPSVSGVWESWTKSQLICGGRIQHFCSGHVSLERVPF